MVESWLGDGSNIDISMDQIKDLLGSDKISQVASQLNTGEGDLLGSLTAALPQLMDKSSSSGSLLDSLGGMDSALDMLGKFFKKTAKSLLLVLVFPCKLICDFT